MKRLLLLIPFLLFAVDTTDVDDKLAKILNYHFSMNLSKIYSPFYKRSIIKRDLKSKKSKKKAPVRKNIIRYKYKLLSVMANNAKVRVTKYINNSISNIEYICLHKGVYLNGCEVVEVGDSYVKMRCGKNIRYLRLMNKKIPYIKELK